MLVDDSQVESAAEGSLVGECLAKLGPRIHDSNFCDRECSLYKASLELAKNNLSVVRIKLITIVKSVRYNRVVFFSSWHLSLVCETRPRCGYHIAQATSPAEINSIETNKLINCSIDCKGILGGDLAQNQAFLTGNHEASLPRRRLHTIDITCFFDLQRMGHRCMSIRKLDHVHKATNLANDKNVILNIEQ